MNNTERIIGEFFDPVYDSIGDIHVGYQLVKPENYEPETMRADGKVWGHLEAEKYAKQELGIEEPINSTPNKNGRLVFVHAIMLRQLIIHRNKH